MQEKQADHLRRLKEKVKTPEGVPRLFDLVTVKDEKLKLAFFSALGNTVVAKDLDQVKFKKYIPGFGFVLCTIVGIPKERNCSIQYVHSLLYKYDSYKLSTLNCHPSFLSVIMELA